jgi:hypothetical protein
MKFRFLWTLYRAVPGHASKSDHGRFNRGETPIDPQFGGMSCAGVIEEFEKAVKAIKQDPSTIPAWQVIISKYHPTFLGDCEKAITWAKTMVTQWLEENMLSDRENPRKDAQDIVDKLSSHKDTFDHSKHIHINECIEYGIQVRRLEDLCTKSIDNCNDLQDCVLTIHHTYMHTFSKSNAIKIVENHQGNAMITNILG